MKDYDFCGYATKNDLLCADGRVIRHDAFKDNDGTTVPLVWQHVHDNPMNVLGHALLENRDDGVYAYAAFNDTESGRHAKKAVQNGDVVSMSIFANRLQQRGNDVIHGIIREVSLVLAGANPGALIENVSLAHEDGEGGRYYTEVDTEAVIYSGLEDIEYVEHADDNADDADEKKTKEDDMAKSDADSQETIEDIFNTLTDKQKEAVYFLIGEAMSGDTEEELEEDDSAAHSDEDDEYMAHADSDLTIADVFNTLNDDQKNMVYFLIGQALEDAGAGEGEAKHDDINGGTSMKHNVFDETYENSKDVLSHDEFMSIMEDAKHSNSMKETFIQHGITDIGLLYPEAKLVTPTPDLISRDMGWVDILWNAVKRTPFSRIKSIAANITGSEARARGYVKGALKAEEVITMLSRETTPQTVYKKQKLDRDDVVDITELDIIAFLKQEMRTMLNEELCRAFLVGDGRGVTSPDKIKTDKIRPIYGDDPVFTIYHQITFAGTETEDQKASALVDAAVRSRKDYKGSGTPMFFASNEVISDMLLAKDTIGRRLYKDENELKAALRVSRIVEVPVMENVQRTTGTGGAAKTWDLKAIIVNPQDYTVGCDKGGAVSLFDDFDIDYNQMKYLIETRCCGALTHPYSAIAIEVQNFLSELSVAPMAGSEDLWGTSVSDIQDDVTITDGVISGTLSYIDSGALADGWGAGNFLALDLSTNDFTGLTSVKIGLEPTKGAGLQEIISDPDKAGVFKVTDKYNQKFVVVQTNGKNTTTQKFDLTGLTLESE